MDLAGSALGQPRQDSCTPRGSSVTGSGSASSVCSDDVPRVTRGQSKYRNPRPPRTLNRLPRGFVWTDPDEQLVEESPDRDDLQVATRWCSVRVPENTVYLVERAGVFNRIIEPGIRMLVPGLDRVAYSFSKKMQKLVFATTNVPTSENVLLSVKGTIFYMVVDPVAAAYAVENMKDALVDLAAAAVHDEFGRMSVDSLFSDLQYLWGRIAHTINDATGVWGTRCMRFSTEITLPDALARTYNELVKVRLQQQIVDTRAENQVRTRDVQVESTNREMMIQSESRSLIKHNDAQADADAILIKGDANAGALNAIADALERPSGRDAARVWIASKYIDALSLGLRNNPGTVSIDASGPSKIVDEALNIMESQLRSSRGNSRIPSHVESSVSPPSPSMRPPQRSSPPPPYIRPTPTSPPPRSSSSQERRARPRVRTQESGGGSSGTASRGGIPAPPPPGSGAGYFRTKLASTAPGNKAASVPPSRSTGVERPPVPKSTPLSPRSIGSGEGSREVVKNRGSSSSKQRNLWLSNLPDQRVERAAGDEIEDEDVPAIDFTLVRPEEVSAGWSQAARRTRPPNPNLARKSSNRSVGRPVISHQQSNTTVDSDEDVGDAATAKMASTLQPRRSLEFRRTRGGAAGVSKPRAVAEKFVLRGAGSDGDLEGYTESI